jgi:hypothetical protein
MDAHSSMERERERARESFFARHPGRREELQLLVERRRERRRERIAAQAASQAAGHGEGGLGLAKGDG